MENKKLFLLSILNSLGVLAYVSLVVLFMSNAQKIFGKNDNLMTGVIVLLIFILSALITGSLVLGRPILFYLEGKKAEGIKLLFYTIISLAVVLVIVILAYLGLK
ncbi:MAG: hypothetical protein V1801_02155 [Candidatus Falkowbacteria bacterium]